MLSELVRGEPVMADGGGREAFSRLREFAAELIAKTTLSSSGAGAGGLLLGEAGPGGGAAVAHEATDKTMRRIERASVVSSTPVRFQQVGPHSGPTLSQGSPLSQP